MTVRHGGVTSSFALDAGCALVAERFDHPDGTRSEKHLLSLQTGEPLPASFAVSASYREVAPSLLFAGIEAAKGARLDAIYTGEHAALLSSGADVAR